MSQLQQTKTSYPKILAVDDRPENLVALKAMLKNLDAELVMVTSGAEALSEVLRHEFALILMDVQMPEMDGFEAAGLIREYEPAQHVPLIFVTAINKNQVYIQKGYELGCIDYVCKPVEPDILRSKVRAFLEMYREKERLQEVTQQLQQTQQALTASHQEIRESKIYLENIIASMAESLMVLDGSFVIQAINPATNALLGYQQEELLGKSISHVIGNETFFGNGQEGVLGQSTQQHQELIFSRKDGTQIPVLFSLASMQQSDQAPLRFVCLAQNITAQKHAAEELEQARDLALAGMKAKSKFLATMSHEIRTPMNGIIGMADFLMDSVLTPEQQDYVQTLKVSGDALLTVINDILDFSKIEAGKMSLEIITFPLRKVVEEVMDLIAIQAHPKGLEVVSLIHGHVPPIVKGDPGRLRQVLLNLLGNAVKFTKAGEVVLHVAVVSQAEKVSQIRFEVIDTGIGMSDEIQAHVFAPFSQGDESTAREFGGTGLGLVISQKLVEMMGGEIGFESKVNQGTQMWFTSTMICSEVQPMVSLTPLPPLRVALSLRHPRMASDVQQFIQDWGGQVQAIDIGEPMFSALMAAVKAKRPFDVLILEVADFEAFGQSFFQQIHQAEGLAALRVMIVTALGKPGDGKLARTLGAAAYLTKPIKYEQLHRALGLVMGQNQEERDTGASSLVTRHTIEEQQVSEGCRVLLAEDNLVNQKVAVRMLSKLGYVVDVVVNGQEAVAAMMGTTTYAVVLMDCMMPEMDGYEATIKIREAEVVKRQATEEASPDTVQLSSDRIPIIAVTANAFDEDKDKCLASGMDDFLPKPLKIEDLGIILEKWVPRPKPLT